MQLIHDAHRHFVNHVRYNRRQNMTQSMLYKLIKLNNSNAVCALC